MSSILTSPPFSPPSFSSTPDSMALSGIQSRSSSSLPRQQSVASASQVPPNQSRSSSSTPHTSSNQYIEQHRTFMEHQRKLHEEERGLWDLERRELHQRIQELEHTIRSLGGQANTFAASNSHFVVAGNSSTGYRQSSYSSGDEFWRGAGGKSDAHPTRTFSENSDRSQSLSTISNHLPSISEERSPRKKSVGFAGMDPVSPPAQQDFHIHPIPSFNNVISGVSTIPGDRISASLDGISFKASGLPPNIAKAASNSGTPSPMGTPASHSNPSSSTSGVPSVVPKPKLLHLPSSELTVDDLRKKDAGHTPLARLLDTESNASSQETPTLKVSEQEQPPYEPAPSRLRPPAERSDSYFPASDEEPGASLPIVDEDPALSGPLNLQGDPNSKENDQFLHLVDSRLLQAQRSNSLDTTSDTAVETELRRIRSADDRPADAEQEGTAEARGLENEEPEPRLRIKRSMNFGSAFGSNTVGKDV